MNNYRSARAAALVGLVCALCACSGMTQREKDTALGAGVGAAAGAVLSKGSVVGTGVGAAVGGVLGHEYGKGSGK